MRVWKRHIARTRRTQNTQTTERHNCLWTMPTLKTDIYERITLIYNMMKLILIVKDEWDAGWRLDFEHSVRQTTLSDTWLITD
jgi:hypothetical protein